MIRELNGRPDGKMYYVVNLYFGYVYRKGEYAEMKSYYLYLLYNSRGYFTTNDIVLFNEEEYQAYCKNQEN